jgi:hypothetical protein
MRPRSDQNQSTFDRRIARRRFVALASVAVLAAGVLTGAVTSQATSLATAVLRGADIVSDGPALAGNHVAHARRPASLAGQRAITRPAAAEEPFPAGPAGGSAPVAPATATGAIAVAPAETPSVPASHEETETPIPVEEGPVLPPVEPPPPPKTDPEPPPNEPPPKSDPEPPPKSEPEPPPKVEPNEPVEEVPEPPSTGEKPFFEGARIADFHAIEAAPNAVTEVPDPLGGGETVIKMTVSDDDVAPITPTENPRAQALTADIINSGDEFWLSTKFLLPQDFPTNVPGWVGLGSIYGEPFNGPSPWQLDIEGDHICWPRNSNYNWDVPWQMPIVTDRWITVVLHERFAADGWVEMWVDGQRITFFTPGSSYNPSKIAPTDHLAMETMDKSNNGGPNSAKIANYRLKGMFPSLTVYFGALKLGETRASVEG